MLDTILKRGFLFFTFFLLLIAYLPVQADDTAPAEPNEIKEETIDKSIEEISENEDIDEEPDEEDVYPFEMGNGDDIEDDTGDDESFFSFLDSPREYLSSGVEGMARGIDQFFVEDEIFYESSGSYLRLIHSIIFEDGGERRSLNTVRFKLRLPNTEKNLKLFFETSKVDEPYNVTTQDETSPNTLGEEGDYVMGVQGESGDRFGWKYKPTIGAHLESPIDTFVRFKFSREDKLGLWTVSWDETPYWQDSVGWGFDSSLVFNRKIDDENLFRSSTYAGWENSTDMFDLRHVFSLFHTINKKKAISFYSAAYGESESKIITTQFLLGSVYRENIHKDYVFFEIEPQIRYQRINNFKPEHSIALRLELLFEK